MWIRFDTFKTDMESLKQELRDKVRSVQGIVIIECSQEDEVRMKQEALEEQERQVVMIKNDIKDR